MIPSQPGFWTEFEDKEGDTEEKRSFNARARLERRLVLIPGSDGKCALEKDEEEENRRLAMAEDLPEYAVKRSIDGIAFEDVVLWKNAPEVAPSRYGLFCQWMRERYYSWIRDAEDLEHWMRKDDFPKYLRLVLHRPLMSHDELCAFMDELGVYRDYCDRIGKEITQNSNHRLLLRGVSKAEITHPSTVYQHVLRIGQDHNKQQQTLSTDTSIPEHFAGGCSELETISGEDVSESQWRSVQVTAIQHILDTIKNFRHGGYEPEEIEAEISDHLTSTNFCIKKYATKLKDPNSNPMELASEIYADSLFDDSVAFPTGEDVDDGNFEEDVEDIANAITLFRRGVYSLEETKAAIREPLGGLRYPMSKYVLWITNHALDAEVLALQIYQHAVAQGEGSQGQDDDEDVRNESRAGESDHLTAGGGMQSHALTGRTLGGVLKISLSSSSRLAAIYHDVLRGHQAIHKAPSVFRSALSKPDMSTTELSALLYQNDIPADLFFTKEQMAGGSMETWESAPDTKHARSAENKIDHHNTPPNSRKSSARHTVNAKDCTEYPDTPPLHDDEMPPLERAAVMDQYINGNLTENLFLSATQKHATEPVTIDCLYEDDEEAEVPESFWYEDASEHLDAGDGDVEQEQASSGGEASKDGVSEGREERETQDMFTHTPSDTSSVEVVLGLTSSIDPKSTKTFIECESDVAEDEEFPTASPPSQEELVIGDGSSLPVKAIASGSSPLQPTAASATTNDTATQPKPPSNTEGKLDGFSMGPPPVPVKRDPRPQSPKVPYKAQLPLTLSKTGFISDQLDEDDRQQSTQVGYQNMREIYMDLGNSSPEDGETEDLHGIRMLTRNAQQLALKKHKLTRAYVETFIRSDTTERAPQKKAKKASRVQFVPILKRRRVVSPSEGPASESAKYEDEIIQFADEDDDHHSFMERRMKAQGPVPDVPLHLCCDRCERFPCVCRGRGRSLSPREMMRQPTPPMGSSSRGSPSIMVLSSVRKRGNPGVAEASNPRGRQTTPRFGGTGIQRMPGACRESSESALHSAIKSTYDYKQALERCMIPMGGAYKSTSTVVPTFRYKTDPPTPIHSSKPGRLSLPIPASTTGDADTVLRTNSEQEFHRQAICPPIPFDLPASHRSTTPISIPTTRVGGALMHQIVEELAPRAVEELKQLRTPKVRENIDLSNLQQGDGRSHGPESDSGMLSIEHGSVPESTENSSSSATIAPNVPSGGRFNVTIKEINLLDADDDCPSLDSILSSLEDEGDNDHTKSPALSQPEPSNVSPRQLISEAMGSSALLSPSLPKSPPAPRLRKASSSMDGPALAMPLQSPPADLPPNRQRVLTSPSDMPDDYFEKFLAKLKKYHQRTIRDKEKNPQKLRPRVPKKPADDLYERAKDAKVSPYVYLWQRRRNRQLANPTQSSYSYYSTVSGSGRNSASTSLNKLFDKYRG